MSWNEKRKVAPGNPGAACQPRASVQQSTGVRGGLVGLLSVFVVVALPIGVSPVAAGLRVTRSASTNSPPASPATGYVKGSAEAGTCSLLYDLELTNQGFAYYFDKNRGVSELFVSGGFDAPVLLHEIDAQLNQTVTSLPIPNGGPALAADLDGDGQIELVVLRGSGIIGDGWLDIYSAPDWRLRSRFIFPGMQGLSNPVAVNIDTDPYLELFFTVSGFSGDARAGLAKYDAVRDTFVVIADIDAPPWTCCGPAVGDFDGDGRVEFIVGNWYGYGLFAYNGQTLSFVDYVLRDSLAGSEHWSAVACRPKPDGELYALLGSSGFDVVYRAWLLKPTGLNRFEIVRTFQEQGSEEGLHDVYAADIDCDGLDELLLNQEHTQIWEWNDSAGDFVPGCLLDTNIVKYFGQPLLTDLNQNGAKEWSGLRYDPRRHFFSAFEDPRCLSCNCSCHADPTCDGITDILDVVGIIGAAFGGQTKHVDEGCPKPREDVDCNGVVDLIDVVKMINVAIRGQDRATQFCNPCP